MSQNVYEILALGARYVFAALMVLIVARAWRITIIDSRRAKTLRRISPETGLSGELIVMAGDEKARRGMRYPVIREGMIGSSRRADIRIRHSSVRRRHAWFQLTPEGLSLRAHAGAPLRDGRGRQARELTLKDGDRVGIGRVQLLLVLTDAPGEIEEARPPRRPVRRRDEGDEWLEPDPDRLFEENPVLNRMAERDMHEEEPPEDLFDIDEDGYDGQDTYR